MECRYKIKNKQEKSVQRPETMTKVSLPNLYLFSQSLLFFFVWFCEFDHKVTIINFVTKKFNVLFVTVQQFPKFISIVLCTPQNNLHCLLQSNLCKSLLLQKTYINCHQIGPLEVIPKDILTLHCIYCNKRQVILM